VITDRTERLLALLLLEQMKGSTQGLKAIKLSLAGFSNLEIADILQTTSVRVADALYSARQASTTSKVRKSQSKKT
jgi:hypothetical protein